MSQMDWRQALLHWRIQFKRSTTEAWESSNPILLIGEPGLDTTENRIKLGDGETAWIDLPWASGLLADVAEAVAAAEAADLSADAALVSETNAALSELAAQEAADSAAAQAALLASIPAALAAAQGYWIVVDDVQPTAATMYGVPIIWVAETSSLAPVPVNPPVPTWNDATSQFTVPSGVVGVDYVWTSGGGGVGAIVTQGSTISTSGAFTRAVVITPTPKNSSYVLATPGLTFKHDFPDPSLITALTSDGFSGGDVITIEGRTSDAALGGTGKPYELTGQRFGITAGQLVGSTDADGWHTLTFPGVENVKVEFDFTLNAESGYVKPLFICLGTVANGVCQFGLGRAEQYLRYSDPDTGLGVILNPPALVQGTTYAVTVQWYVTTLTVKIGTLYEASFTTSAIGKGSTVTLRNANGLLYPYTVDNLKISRVGF